MKSSLELIKELRERTNASLMDCKKALQNTNNNIEEAILWLRKHGITKAQAKSVRSNNEGLIKTLIKENKAIILELNSETDFVSRNEQFINLFDKIAIILLDEEPNSIEEALNLLHSQQTISDLLNEATYKLGEKITISRFNLLKKTDDESWAFYNYQTGRIATLLKLQGKVKPEIANQIALQIIVKKPIFITNEDVCEKFINQELEVINAQINNELESKRINIQSVEKIRQGRLKKQLDEVVLLNQGLYSNEKQSFESFLTENNTKVLIMYRYEIGVLN